MKIPQEATKEFPTGYGVQQVLDLSENRKILVLLSLASLGFFVLSWFVFTGLIHLLRPDLTLGEAQISLVIDDPGRLFISLLVFLGVVVTMLVLHEGIHGLAFWLITGSNVVFGFKGPYAYAAAPEWYIPKNPYLVVSLAPLLLITLLGFLALLAVPVPWILPLLLLITMNASGAVGDIYVFFWLLRKDDDILIQDHGDRMVVFTPDGDVGGDCLVGC